MTPATSHRVVALIQSVEPVTGNDRWRVEQPFRALAERQYDAWATSANNAGIFQGGKIIDALVQPRIAISNRQGAKIIRRALDDTGARLVIDYDDRLDIVPLWNEYSQSNPPWDWCVYALEIADAVTVSTPALKRWVERDLRLGKPVEVFPNRVRPGLYQRTKRERLTVGLIGARSHLKDWATIAPVLQRAVDAYPEVDFLIVGGDLEVSGPNVIREVTQPWREYRQLMGSCDIGLAPLTDSQFNRGRSPLKWVEWGSVGVPVICSHVVYNEVVTDQTDALVAHSLADWESYLHALILNADLRASIGAAAKRKVDAEWTETDATCEQRWRFYIGEQKWKLARSSAASSSLPALSPSSPSLWLPGQPLRA